MDLAKVIINLLVGLVVFVTGMNLMSTGLKAAAGRSIRRLFKKIKDNRIAASLIGAGTTALIQSSGATTVMVVGFLGAGALTFIQGFSLMLGAFLGTTITGVLVSLSSFSFSMFLMALAFLGFLLGFFKSPTIKSIGEILVGFGILFFGLEAMKSAFGNADIQAFLVSMINALNFPLLLLLIGLVLTGLTQSSSATNGIVIVMVAANPDFLYSGFYLVLGATVGALLPTILAAIKSNILGKRVTYTMLICRFVGAIIATLAVWALTPVLAPWLSSFHKDDVGMILALFTVIYNLLFLVILLPLGRPMETFSVKVFRDRDAEKKRQQLRHINDSMLNTPSVAIIQVKREIQAMLEMSRVNFFLGYACMVDQDLSKARELEEREETIDYLNEAISEYLIKLSPHASYHDEIKIGSYYHVINDIERIGDHAYNFLESAKKMKEEDLMFSDKAKAEFEKFRVVLEEMFVLADKVFMLRKRADLEKLHALEEQADEMKKSLSDAHFLRIKKNECNNALSPFHSTFLSELERVSDHLTNIGYSTVNPTGDTEEHTYRRA